MQAAGQEGSAQDELERLRQENAALRAVLQQAALASMPPEVAQEIQVFLQAAGLATATMGFLWNTITVNADSCESGRVQHSVHHQQEGIAFCLCKEEPCLMVWAAAASRGVWMWTCLAWIWQQAVGRPG